MYNYFLASNKVTLYKVTIYSNYIYIYIIYKGYHITKYHISHIICEREVKIMNYTTLKKILTKLNTQEYLTRRDIKTYDNKGTRQALQQLHKQNIIEIKGFEKDDNNIKKFIKENKHEIRKRHFNKSIRYFYRLKRKGELILQVMSIVKELYPFSEASRMKNFLKNENLQLIAR